MNLNALEVDRSTTVDRVASTLRQAIFDGVINPGDQLREQVLAKQLGVSRNTVREALRMLTSDGLTAHVPNRGVAVRSLSIHDVEDIFLARMILEREAARASAICAPEALQALSDAMEAYAAAASLGEASKAANAHVDFHTVMVALCGSRRLAETERILLQELQVIIAAIDRSSDDLPSEVEKHRTILQLFRERDVEGAIRCIENDLDHAKAFVLRRAKLPEGDTP